MKWTGASETDPAGRWEITDPAGVKGTMTTVDYNPQMFPLDDMAWTYYNHTRTSVVSGTVRGDDGIIGLNPVNIVCQETAIPTRYPSNCPSVLPTTMPSGTPSS